MAEPKQSLIAPPPLSEEAREHLCSLLLHRDDLAVLSIDIKPERCELCDEIRKWALAAKGRGGS